MGDKDKKNLPYDDTPKGAFWEQGEYRSFYQKEYESMMRSMEEHMRQTNPDHPFHPDRLKLGPSEPKRPQSEPTNSVGSSASKPKL